MSDEMRLTAVEQAVREIADADAARFAFVTLRCDRESDIISAVDAYIRRVSRDSGEAGEERAQRLFTAEGWSACCLADGTPAGLSDATLPGLLDACDRKPNHEGMQRILFYIPDLFRFLEPGDRDAGNALDLALLKRVGMGKMCGRNNLLVLIGCTDGRVCRELADYGYLVDIPYPEPWEIERILADACAQCGGQSNELEPSTAKRLAEAMRGFREWDVRRVINMAYAKLEYPLRQLENVQSIIYEEKHQRIDRIPGLHWIGREEITEVCGLDALQTFLQEMGRPFREPLLAKIQRAEPPKAVFIAGLPGGGKSTIANLSASILGKKDPGGNELPLPLLHLSLTDMLDKYVGQSERNFTLATQALEGIAPCVVVIDELEKIFGGVDRESSSEVGSNLFSQFLQWMEKPQKKRMLIIATANRIDRLPSECKRKGRFDEIFSVNIPNRRECLAIVKVHLKKYEDVLEAAEGGTDAVIDELAEAFMRLAARKRRFVSGADIEGICRFLFTSLFSSYISSLERDPEGLRSAQAGGKPFQYPKAEVLAALETEIGRTRSFFDSNMAETAQYWLQTKELAFRSASEEGDDLFQSAGYLFAEDTYKFYVQSGESGKRQPVCGEPYAKNLEAMAANAAQSGDYDGALRATLAKYIYAQKPKN